MTDKTSKIAGISITVDPTMPRNEISLRTSTGDSVTVTNLGESGPSSVVEALPTEQPLDDFLRLWFEQMKADDPHHFAEHEENPDYGDMICMEYKFDEHFMQCAFIASFRKVFPAFVATLRAEKAELSRQLEQLESELRKPEHYWRNCYKKLAVVDVVQKKKLAEATRELEQLKLERGREVHPAD